MNNKYEGHTPGPWIKRMAIPGKSANLDIKNERIISVGIGQEVGKDYTAVAFCGDISNEQAHANARLIADAPTILHHAEKLAKALRNYINYPSATNKIVAISALSLYEKSTK